MRTYGFVAFLSCCSLIFVVCGCGKSPGRADAEDAIRKAILEDRTVGLEVTSINVEKWEGDKESKDDDQVLTAKWTAKLHFTEPYGFVAMSIGGKPIVRPVLNKGRDLQFNGTITANKHDGQWKCQAFADNNPWEPVLGEVGMITNGYRECDADGMPGNMVPRHAGFVGDRGYPLEAISQISGGVVLGTPEGTAFMADVDVRQKKRAASDAAAAQKIKDDADAKHLAQLQQKKLKADEKRDAAIKPWLDPFRSKAGAVIVSDAGVAMGLLITDAQIDETNLKISGKGIDLREMPFREFTFDAAVEPRNFSDLTIKTSLATASITFGSYSETGLAGAGAKLVILDDAGRAPLDATVQLAQKLSSAAPLQIAPEILDADQAAQRQAGFKTAPLTGTILEKDKKAPALSAMFSGDLAKNKKVYRWSKESIAIRLDQPVQAKAIYIEGSTSASEAMTVTINGVHKINISAIPKGGGVVIALPPDLQVLELRLETDAVAQCRGVMLIQ